MTTASSGPRCDVLRAAARWTRMPRAPCCSISAGGRSVAATSSTRAVGVAHGQHDRLAGGRARYGAAAGGPRHRPRRCPSNTGKRWPSMARMRSPRVVVDRTRRPRHVADLDCRPPAGRGRRRVRLHGPDADVRDRVGERAMSEKMSHASRKFMTTPASRMHEAGAQSLVDEGARVGRFALLPFQAHEAADGQPVERVDRLRAAMEDRAPAAGSRCRTRGPARRPRRAMTKWPSSWMHHEHDEDDEQQDDVDEAVEDHARADPPAVSAARAQARTSASSASSSSTSGCGAAAEALDRVRGERGHAREAELPSRNRSTATSSARDERGRGARARCVRPHARCASAGKRVASGASNVRFGCSSRSSRGAGPGRAGGHGRGRTGWGCACQGVPAGP